MDAHSKLRGCWRLAALAAVVLSACGGGGGGDSAGSTPSASAPPRPVTQSDLQIAQSVYGSGPRTPVGFYSDPLPSGHEYVSTMHLKNADVDAAVVAPQPLYELCTDDWNEALAWSELGAQHAPQYADLVETNDDPRYFEFGRVRQGDPTFYVRARVFKCAYLDRAAANLRATVGPAGTLNRRPLTAVELRDLSEYLWQFTKYNNVGYAVLDSSGSAGAANLSHTLHIGALARGGISSGCDRVDVIAWRHTLDTTSGTLQLEATTLWSFGAREASGVVSLCSL
ncbi:MAG TPA: hypothetical protein VN705_24800 [Steroidobacteraceae bacterium]|nr:hypothetical protein [Steroidobacteraceae bacterium]